MSEEAPELITVAIMRGPGNSDAFAGMRHVADNREDYLASLALNSNTFAGCDYCGEPLKICSKLK